MTVWECSGASTLGPDEPPSIGTRALPYGTPRNTLPGGTLNRMATRTITVEVPVTCLNCQTTLHLPMNANTNRAWVPNPHLAWLWLWANAHQGPIRILDPD